MILIALTLHLATTQPAAISGSPRIIDGDTIAFGKEHVRFGGTDSPESNQPCADADGHPYAAGAEATQHLIELIHGRPVTCSSDGTPQYSYGRVIAFCTASGDRESLNQRMVEDGEAFAYEHYDIRYVVAENAARAEKIGIWRGYCEEPWKFRQEERR